MITEDYISFETAKLLKEKGFNERLLTFYITDEAKKEGCFQLMAFTDDKIDNNHSDHCYLAPTLQMAMKWLREEYNIDILITIGGFIEKGKVYFCSAYKNLINYGDLKECLTYKEACEEAILYCLKNLI